MLRIPNFLERTMLLIGIVVLLYCAGTLAYFAFFLFGAQAGPLISTTVTFTGPWGSATPVALAIGVLLGAALIVWAILRLRRKRRVVPYQPQNDPATPPSS